MEETTTVVRRAIKWIGFICVIIGGALILLDGYYWGIDSSFANFIWSAAKAPTWWSATGHIPLSYWGMTCGILVLIGGALTLVPKEDFRTLGSAVAVIFSVISVAASGGWMIGFILGIVGTILRFM